MNDYLVRLGFIVVRFVVIFFLAHFLKHLIDKFKK